MGGLDEKRQRQRQRQLTVKKEVVVISVRNESNVDLRAAEDVDNVIRDVRIKRRGKEG
uniref:Uncharacterized protein n=1 Tax=Cucumis sativus TaxID=3659 RepID=A0A0A0K4Z1_CUCSA